MERTVLSLTLYKNVSFETALNCLEYYSSNCDLFINGFIRAALIDLVKTPSDNDLLTLFVIELILIPRDSYPSQISLG